MPTGTSLAEPHRNTIFEEAAGIIANAAHPGGQFIMRLAAPKIAETAQPGQFVHIRVAEARPMRRPLSIMQTDPARGTVDLLVKTVGEGTALLAGRKAGETLACMGPIGRPFDLADTTRRYVLIGGGVGIPPMIFAALRLRGQADAVVFAGSEVEFPFALKPSGFMLPGIDGNAILGIVSLEDWGVPSRLASNAGLYGCFAGHVPDLARTYLEALDTKERGRTVLLSCGPHPMLHAVARLGRDMGIPTQLSLEEYMACGLGGCAGCVVRTVENDREYYRRVCVDGPVFPADILPEFA
jgi:dihydroorotate dehydrogenase electron transfer subunit